MSNNHKEEGSERIFLVPAHPGCPRKRPVKRILVVVVVVVLIE